MSKPECSIIYFTTRILFLIWNHDAYHLIITCIISENKFSYNMPYAALYYYKHQSFKIILKHSNNKNEKKVRVRNKTPRTWYDSRQILHYVFSIERQVNVVCKFSKNKKNNQKYHLPVRE